MTVSFNGKTVEKSVDITTEEVKEEEEEEPPFYSDEEEERTGACPDKKEYSLINYVGAVGTCICVILMFI